MKIIPFLLIFLIIPAVFAAQYEPLGYVSDYADITDDETEAQINALAVEIEQNTTAEIAVLTINSLEGQNIDQFAVETFEQWGVGKEGVDNGLLIVIAVDDKQWKIEVGYGLEGTITDAQAGRVGRARFVENFLAGDYGKGIYEAVSDFKALIEKDPTIVSAYAAQETAEDKEWWFVIGWVLLFVLLFGYVFGVFLLTDSLKKKKAVRLTFVTVFALAILYTGNWIATLVFLLFCIPLTFGKAMKGGSGGGGGYGGPRRSSGWSSGGSSGSSFGGFGGGRSGGGGASGGW